MKSYMILKSFTNICRNIVDLAEIGQSKGDFTVRGHVGQFLPHEQI
jgi:hypothetical protein